MKIFNNYPLKNKNTFQIEYNAQNFIVIEHPEELLNIHKTIFSKSYYILGSGSNTLFLKVPQNIVHLQFKGIEIVNEDKNHVFVKVMAGEEWDNFVEYCVQHNWGGLENLSLIPGTAGAAPVQNVGAYGIEVKDALVELCAFNIKTGQFVIFNNKDCQFEYRNSFFKKHPQQWIIIHTTYKLTKNNHRFCLTYGNLQELIDINKTNLQEIRNTIINIRQAKLPDYKVFGNAGSFFKNPVVDSYKLSELKITFPQLPYYSIDDNNFKIPAAWLIEQAGLKNYRKGDVGTYLNQPLVIVNYGNATAQEIYDFSQLIIETIYQKFNIKLEIEVNIV